MNVVLDANVIIAAFATRGLCNALFEVCLDSHELLMSEELLAEADRGLRRKIKLPGPTADAIIRLLRQNSRFCSPLTVEKTACRDPKDLHVLGLAAAGNADCIVTGDADLLVLGKCGKCRIVSPRQFSDLIRRATGGRK